MVGGEVATVAAVQVEAMMEIERYSHVMHISSTVTGTLLPELGVWDVLRAALPAGTVSGAPKASPRPPGVLPAPCTMLSNFATSTTQSSSEIAFKIESRTSLHCASPQAPGISKAASCHISQSVTRQTLN